MEDNATRAIIIGVGLFVILLTISGIILYVNAARNMANVVDKSLNTWDNITYNNIMDYKEDITIKCTGMDFINFIRKNVMREDIFVTTIAEDTVILNNVSMSYWKSDYSDNASELKLASISVDSEVIMRKRTVTDQNGVNTYYITVEFSTNLATSVEAYTNLTDAKNGENAIVADEKVMLTEDEMTIYYKVIYSKNEAVSKITGVIYSGGSPVSNTLGNPEVEDTANSYSIYAVNYGNDSGLINSNFKTYVKVTVSYKKYGQLSANSVEFEFEKGKNYSEHNGVIIPKGFYYVGGEKNSGLVISDSSLDKNKGVDANLSGNQFVWVPVDNYSDFVRSESSTSYTEPYAKGYSTELEEYNDMCESVKKYNGFYIARFEAGDGDVTSARISSTTAHKVVSKKGAYVYNWVSWGVSMKSVGTTGAVYLSRNMYKGNKYVVSTLCYGVQWDAVMNFVNDTNHNIANSRSWGNYNNSTDNAKTNSGESNMNYTTGRSEAWKAKNIYDLAGNLWEWTMEAYSSNNRVIRGGCYYASGKAAPASGNSKNKPSTVSEGYTFRPALYIKLDLD